MIRAIVGGIGQGKSVTLTRICLEKIGTPMYVNFPLRLPKVTRLLGSQIVATVTNPLGNGKQKTYAVNYDFWKEAWTKEGFSIFLDEAHNIIGAREAMSKWNIEVGKWISQIRKLLGTNEDNDLILASQRIEGIDVAARKLAAEIIECQKIILYNLAPIPTIVLEDGILKTKMLHPVMIILYIFQGTYCLDKYLSWRDYGDKTYDIKSGFIANPFFQYYDSYALIDFGKENLL